MSIKKIIIKPGCIACGSCQFIAPEVFEVNNIVTVKKGCDLDKNRVAIEKAMKKCPVQVITIERNNTK